LAAFIELWWFDSSEYIVIAGPQDRKRAPINAGSGLVCKL